MFNFFKRKTSKTETNEYKNSCSTNRIGQQEIILQGNDFLNYVVGYGQGLSGFEKLSFDRAMKFYQQSSSVATAVDIISQEISRIKPVIKTPDGKLEDSSPIIDKLMNPNDWNEDWSFFFGSIAKSYLITGNSYTYASGIVKNPPLELYSIKPQNVNTNSGNLDQRPNAYTIYNGDGQGDYTRLLGKNGYRFYEGALKELWQTMSYSSTSSNFHGDSPLKAICLDIYSQIKGRIHNVKLLENGARPSLLVAFKDTMTKDQHNERRQLINEQLAGADNAGKISVISSADLDLQELGINNKDMDYVQLEKISDEAIYKRYRIPLPLISNTSSTYNNMENAVYHLYDFSILPVTDQLFSSLSMFLLPRYGLNPEEYQLTYNPDEIEALKQRRITTLTARKELGIESINELREGLPNRDAVEGADSILVQSTLIPVGEVSLEEDETTVEEETQELLERDLND